MIALVSLDSQRVIIVAHARIKVNVYIVDFRNYATHACFNSSRATTSVRWKTRLIFCRRNINRLRRCKKVTYEVAHDDDKEGTELFPLVDLCIARLFSLVQGIHMNKSVCVKIFIAALKRFCKNETKAWKLMPVLEAYYKNVE